MWATLDEHVYQGTYGNVVLYIEAHSASTKFQIFKLRNGRSISSDTNRRHNPSVVSVEINSLGRFGELEPPFIPTQWCLT